MAAFDIDFERQLYVGKYLAVPFDLFEDVVDELVEGGCTEAEARVHLGDEADWSADIEGVIVLAFTEAAAVAEALRHLRATPPQ